MTKAGQDDWREGSATQITDQLADPETQTGLVSAGHGPCGTFAGGVGAGRFRQSDPRFGHSIDTTLLQTQ